MKPVAIVVLTKYQEVLLPFLESVGKFASADIPKVFVVDKGDIDIRTIQGLSSTILDGPEKFSMAGNANIGLKGVPEGHDVLYCGDDVRFLEPKTVERLQEIAYSDPTVGILSPKLAGRGSPAQINASDKLQDVKPLEMWFPCIYIKREVIDKIGYLDEQFSEFGSDDLDYCIRTRLAGYRLCVTDRVTVQHEASPEGGPTTFVKKLGVAEYQKQQDRSYEKLRVKYNVGTSTFNRFLSTGNVDLLKAKDTHADDEVGPNTPREKILEFLRSRHIFVATPAYGGMMTVNYTNSLLDLMNTCNNCGVKCSVSFLYNESLITRARNKLVYRFLKSEATDLFFIDADIGFEARDIVSLLFHNKDVIGVPCVTKMLRLDRVYNAGKENKKAYTNDELKKLCGNFVINFPVNDHPDTIDLGQLMEVQDVGTGLMRIQRRTLEKYAEAFPADWYLPMSGEDSDTRVPMYMYFQSGIDTEASRENPTGYADYISEDYMFCRKVRKAGMKVFAAPWVKTSHLGAYIYEGDMESVSKSGGGMR